MHAGDDISRPAAEVTLQPAVMRRKQLLAFFGLLQIVGFLAMIVVVAKDINTPNPWPIVAMFGIVLAQCSLAAAFAVFGPWILSIRMTCSALVVAGGASMILLTEAPRGPRLDEFLMMIMFALLMWLMNQVPLWLCRLLLRARAVAGETAEQLTQRNQYGIRQLMTLTLAVSLILGIGRMVMPQQAFEELKEMKAIDWAGFATIAVGVGLLVSTIIVAVLNPLYWRAGLAVSAASAALVAYGTYSIMEALNFSASADRVYFAFMLLWTYSWLLVSVLILRAAGFRVVVGA